MKNRFFYSKFLLLSCTVFSIAFLGKNSGATQTTSSISRLEQRPHGQYIIRALESIQEPYRDTLAGGIISALNNAKFHDKWRVRDFGTRVDALNDSEFPFEKTKQIVDEQLTSLKEYYRNYEKEDISSKPDENIEGKITAISEKEFDILTPKVIRYLPRTERYSSTERIKFLKENLKIVGNVILENKKDSHGYVSGKLLGLICVKSHSKECIEFQFITSKPGAFGEGERVTKLFRAISLKELESLKEQLSAFKFNGPPREGLPMKSVVIHGKYQDFGGLFLALCYDLISAPIKPFYWLYRKNHDYTPKGIGSLAKSNLETSTPVVEVSDEELDVILGFIYKFLEAK